MTFVRANCQNDVQPSQQKVHTFLAGSGRVILGFIGMNGYIDRIIIFTKVQYILFYTTKHCFKLPLVGFELAGETPNAHLVGWVSEKFPETALNDVDRVVTHDHICPESNVYAFVIDLHRVSDDAVDVRHWTNAVRVKIVHRDTDTAPHQNLGGSQSGGDLRCEHVSIHHLSERHLECHIDTLVRLDVQSLKFMPKLKIRAFVELFGQAVVYAKRELLELFIDTGAKA